MRGHDVGHPDRWLRRLPPPAANDAFAAAETLTGSAGAATGSNGTATKETGEPSHAGDPGGASIWYRWTAPSNGTLALTTSGSAIDTLLGLYTGSTVATLTTVASNDDDGALRTSRIAARPVTSGVTYRIAVDGWGGGQAPSVGATRLEWSFTPASTGSRSPCRVRRRAWRRWPGTARRRCRGRRRPATVARRSAGTR